VMAEGKKNHARADRAWRASAPASDLARLLDETGGERVMRSIAPRIGCPRRSGYEFLPLNKERQPPYKRVHF
jgi:hypothetical protein